MLGAICSNLISGGRLEHADSAKDKAPIHKIERKSEHSDSDNKTISNISIQITSIQKDVSAVAFRILLCSFLRSRSRHASRGFFFCLLLLFFLFLFLSRCFWLTLRLYRFFFNFLSSRALFRPSLNTYELACKFDCVILRCQL